MQMALVSFLRFWEFPLRFLLPILTTYIHIYTIIIAATQKVKQSRKKSNNSAQGRGQGGIIGSYNYRTFIQETAFSLQCERES